MYYLPIVKKVLVADDDNIIREVVIQALTQFGHETYAAKNGSEAIEVLKANPEIDTAVLDLDMPVMSGREACYKLKNIKPNLKIIIASATINENELKGFQLIGVNCFLRKPYQLALLLEIISNHSACRE